MFDKKTWKDENFRESLCRTSIALAKLIDIQEARVLVR